MLLHDFTPLSSPLVLSKILIVYQEPPKRKTATRKGIDSDEEPEQQLEVIDYSKIAENLFFRVYEGTSSEAETLLYDQLDMNCRIDKTTG